MATTTFRRDHLLRRVLNPGTTATDAVGRLTTATADYLGRLLVAIDWPTTATALTLGAYYDVAATRVLYKCTVAGTSAAGTPTAPGVGNTVVSGTATLLQMTNG